MQLVDKASGLLIAPVVDLGALRLRQFQERTAHHRGAQDRRLPGRRQTVTSEETEIRGQAGSRNPGAALLITRIEVEQTERR